MTDRELLRAAITASGLSARKFAKTVVVVGVNERTVRRWLAGDSPLPQAVRKKLEMDLPKKLEME